MTEYAQKCNYSSCLPCPFCSNFTPVPPLIYSYDFPLDQVFPQEKDHVFFFFFFWLCWVFVAAHRLFLVAVSRYYPSFRCAGFSLWWFLLHSTGSRHRGFSSCSSRAQQLQLTGSSVQAPPARGIFLDQGLNLCPLPWQADSHPLYHRGSSSCIFNHAVIQ